MDDRAIVLRLGDRTKDDRVPHATPGDNLSANALSMREGAVRERVITLKAGPNAPLLMRIVRSPYALAVTAGKRVQLLERTRTEAPTPLGRPGAEWRASRPGRLFRSPLRIAHGMPERMRPRKPTSQVAPSTSQLAPSTSQVAPSTSQVAPSTSQVAPSTSQVAPSTSQVAP
jgi:hypothetical protein